FAGEDERGVEVPALDGRVIRLAFGVHALLELGLAPLPGIGELVAQGASGDPAPVEIAHHVEDGGADGRVATCFHDALLRLRRGERFLRGAEARADEDAVRAERHGGIKAATIDAAASAEP